MSRNHDPKDDDIALFRQSIGKVRPLSHSRVELEKKRPRPIPVKTFDEEAQVLAESLIHDPSDFEVETGEELNFARPGIQHNTLRKLRRGQFAIEAELDLHGMTVAVAKPALIGFMQRCQVAGIRCVRIVHGKGKGSPDKQPVLKRKLNSWLRQWDPVLAFVSAPGYDGGTGAAYVLLKRSP